MPRTRLRAEQIVDEDVVTDVELAAGFKTDQVVADVFPISVASTDSGTKTVTLASGGVEEWLQAGDVAEISGGTPSGDYTVASIVSDTEFTVEDTIPDSTSEGSFTGYHAIGAAKVGVDPSPWSNITGTTVQSALESADIQSEELDSLVHNLSEDYYSETTFQIGRATNITVWTDSNKTTKVREYQYTYERGSVTQEVRIQYDTNGVEVQRLTLSYTYDPSGRLITTEATET